MGVENWDASVQRSLGSIGLFPSESHWVFFLKYLQVGFGDTCLQCWMEMYPLPECGRVEVDWVPSSFDCPHFWHVSVEHSERMNLDDTTALWSLLYLQKPLLSSVRLTANRNVREKKNPSVSECIFLGNSRSLTSTSSSVHCIWGCNGSQGLECC